MVGHPQTNNKRLLLKFMCTIKILLYIFTFKYTAEPDLENPMINRYKVRPIFKIEEF